MKSLHDYCKEKKIRIEDLSVITEVGISNLYLVANNPQYNITIATINKIYTKTKEKYGEGLLAKDYLDFECLKK